MWWFINYHLLALHLIVKNKKKNKEEEEIKLY